MGTEIIEGTGTAEKGKEKGTDSSSMSTGTRARKTRARTGTRTRTRTETKKEEVSGLASVEKSYEEKKEEYDKKQVEREKAGIKQEAPLKVVEGTEVAEEKPKRKRTTRKKKTTVDSEAVEKLLLTVSSIVATRKGMEHWQLTKQECKTIAEPLVEVMDKYDVSKSFADNAPEIALAVACISVATPRVMISAQKRKVRKNDGMGGKAEIGSAGKRLDENRKSKIVSRKDDGKSTANTQNDDSEYGVFGLPL